VVATFADAVVSYLKVARPSDATKARVARLLKHFRTIKLSLINQTAIDKSCEKPLRPGTRPEWAA
jgi:hypothetical protein